MYVQDITNRTNQAASVSLSASHTKTSITPFQKVLEKENALYAAASEENTKSVSLKKTTAKTTEKTSSASKTNKTSNDTSEPGPYGSVHQIIPSYLIPLFVFFLQVTHT